MASSSAGMIVQPQVNSMVLRGEDSDRRWPMRSWLAPAPSTRTRIFRRNRDRDLPQGRGQHLLMVGEGVRPGVAGPQLHGQALAGIAAPGPQGVETVALSSRSGPRPSLSE